MRKPLMTLGSDRPDHRPDRLDASFDVFNVTNNDAFQEFFAGQSNLKFSPFYIIGPDGNIRANNRRRRSSLRPADGHSVEWTGGSRLPFRHAASNIVFARNCW